MPKIIDVEATNKKKVLTAVCRILTDPTLVKLFNENLTIKQEYFIIRNFVCKQAIKRVSYFIIMIIQELKNSNLFMYYNYYKPKNISIISNKIRVLYRKGVMLIVDNSIRGLDEIRPQVREFEGVVNLLSVNKSKIMYRTIMDNAVDNIPLISQVDLRGI